MKKLLERIDPRELVRAAVLEAQFGHRDDAAVNLATDEGLEGGVGGDRLFGVRGR